MNANQGIDSEISYSVAKTAVAQLTRATAVSLRGFNINVNSIAPGGTLTGRFLATIKDRSKKDREKIFSEADSRLLKPATPDDISGVVSFLLSSKAAYVSGQVIRIDGGQSPFPI
jgi:3-oxoacyl-[acyl-carrier protein] reductase